ncbi:26S proteasome non-ATPase regulatory subunit 10 isoform X2 [Oryctolagus cuniculus]|uniref:26S proteasome non-ATPase regulatory subunit 10 isoform X2 n=2 Tax=Leporidae TaxID=9979 RepID=UPI00048EB0FC|nr:26S proteasome non-ATPase regulatory subunit 10 isoform X2 [Oryctolagus cuniculus]
MPLNCNSQRRRAMGKETRGRGRSVIGGILLVPLTGKRRQRREAGVPGASRRSWESEMEGCVSNLMVCNLAYSGKLEELRESILADKSLATRTDQDSRTALHWACSAGHTEIVEFLLQLGVPVNDKDDAGWSPLHIAASAGRDEIVKALLGKGAQVNAVNQNGCTPLHYAASKNRHEIAVMLLEGGANPDAKDHYEATSMHRAAAKDT